MPPSHVFWITEASCFNSVVLTKITSYLIEITRFSPRLSSHVGWGEGGRGVGGWEADSRMWRLVHLNLALTIYVIEIFELT